MSDGTGGNAIDRTIRLSNGRMLGYAEFGDPNGIPAFYFHGYPGSRLAGQLHAEDAERAGVRLISPDRPGMGLSDFQPGRRILDWPNDVGELADELGIERFAVLGASGGGPYALACAYAIPQRLTLCGVIAGMTPMEYALSAENVKRSNLAIFRMSRRPTWLVHLVLWLGIGRFAGNEQKMRKAMRAMLRELPPEDRSLIEDERIGSILWKDTIEVHRNGTLGCAYELKLYGSDWGFQLEDIACGNVRLWHGELDVNLPADAARKMAKRIPNCNASYYPDEAHLSTMVHRADEIMAAVRQAA